MAKKNDRLSVYILLDRSQSMASGGRWEGAISSINEYVKTLKTNKTPANITVVAFDAPGGWNSTGLDFHVLRNESAISKYKQLTVDEVYPRGNTPLYDATARLFNLADKKNNEKTVILIMTDGEENASRVYNITSIRDRVATCQNRGWEVIFLGAEFNADTIAQNYGLSASKVINTSTRGLGDSMRFYASAASAYTMGKAIDTGAVRDEMKAK